MKVTKKAVSLIESVIVTLVISIGLVGVYSLYSNSMRFLDGIESKIQAIQIAREGIEAVENIRDTNWIVFSSDTKNCWNTLNYEKNCIGGGGNKIEDGNYKIYRDSYNRWVLEKDNSTISDYNDSAYKNFYKVGLDEKGLYNQTGSLKAIGLYKSGKNRQNFTRKIEIKNGVNLKNINNFNQSEDNSLNGINIKSIVEWKDMASSKPRRIEIKNTITNYKK